MNTPTIVGLGEILWDVFRDGPRFGGAPANFACSAAELTQGSCRVEMISAVGDDEFGPPALQALRDHGVGVDYVPIKAQQTGQVLVRLDDKGQATYTFAEDTAWDNLNWSTDLAALAMHTAAVCFGTLGQRSNASQDVIRRFVDATPGDCLRIFDINLRPPYWTPDVIRQSLPLSNILKLNDAELPELAALLDLSGSDEQLAAQLIDHFQLKLVVLTRGDNGSLLVDATGQTSELAGDKIPVVDTVGAGDSFTAAIAVGLLKGLDLSSLHRRAANVAAFVCSRAGATPSIPSHLRFI